MINQQIVKVAVLFLLTFTPIVNYSQNIIQGIVIDSETKEPLLGANVVLAESKKRTITDLNGRFQFTVPSSNGYKRIIITYIGYHTFNLDLTEVKLFDKPIIIKLKKSYLNLDEVVITGTKTERFVKDSPVTTEVISQKQIQNSGASDVKQVLSEINGIVIHENQFGTGVNTVEIQGFSSQHVQVLIDGIKMIGRVNGELDISQVPLSQIEKIEIVKGAASALYGSEAMGGVINIITKKGNNKFSVNSNVTTGSYQRVDASCGANIPLGNWVPNINLSYRKYGGYDLDKTTEAVDGTNYSKYNIGFGLTGKISEKTTLNLKSFFLTEEQIAKSGNIFEDHILNDSFSGKLQLNNKNFIEDLNLKLGIEYSEYEHKYDKKVLSSGFYKKGDITNESLFRADLLADYIIGDHLVNGGYSVEGEKIISDRVIGSNQNSVLQNIFLQDEIFLYEWITFLGGLRLDVHSVYGSKLTPKAAIMLKPLENSRIRLSYSEGFRAPSFKELFIEYINVTVGYHIQGNPDLEPEISNSVQADFEYWNNDNYHLRLHSYFNEISNLIEYKYLGEIDGYIVYTPKNLLNVTTWGGDFEIEYFPYEDLNFKFGYSYFDSENSKTKNPLTFKSKHKFNFSLSLNLYKSIFLNLRGQYFGKQFYWAAFDQKTYNQEIFNEETKVDAKAFVKSYYLLHANVNYQFYKHLMFQAGVRNLNNYINKKWGPMPGREWYIAINFNY